MYLLIVLTLIIAGLVLQNEDNEKNKKLGNTLFNIGIWTAVIAIVLAAIAGIGMLIAISCA